ncbi:MAG TPA: M1 family aminopeptidase [Verrucomicrobiota bacterium]|nr:M1 family aminopeptidase [Verrucomicrobiota bacterium]HNU49477.1 M1 family aminopeptidase [Verrucomicrobiota bacterium]
MAPASPLLNSILLGIAISSLPVRAGDAPPPPRQYAPERQADILHLNLDVTPDFKQRSVRGTAILTFRPVQSPLDRLDLDAEALEIDEVTATWAVSDWQNTGHQLNVTFATPLPQDQETRLTVRYRATPKSGLYFRTPDQGYREGETHLFTQGESIEARHWYPGFDAPNEKFTSEITCRVPPGMIVRSNGRQVSSTEGPDGLVAVRWVQEKPHVNYLVALVAGHFKEIQDRYRDIPIYFTVPPSAIDVAPASFRNTADMLAFFEEEIGIPYPWAQYGQVCVNDFVAGGMENTSLTILTDSTLHPDSTEPVRNSDGLVAHELVHQWFGDLVTCKDWSHLWLNEGFATYYEALYGGHHRGRDEFLSQRLADARGIFGAGDDTLPIVHRQYRSPDEQFSYRAYSKAGWVLHMLRSQLGADLFRRVVRTYLERHAYGLVTTADFQSVLEQVSGRSFDRFFDQWLHHGHYPELDVEYAWDPAARLARVTIRQTQAVTDKVLLFHFPYPIRFHGPTGAVDRVAQVRNREEVFTFRLEQPPDWVRFDPELTVLAKTRFTPPPAMLVRMLAPTNDVVGRFLAVAALHGKRDATTVDRLRAVLEHDPFYGVRIEASRALQAAHSEKALDALLAAVNQPDPRVRLQVRQDLACFYRESVVQSAEAAFAQETHPDVLAQLIRTLGPYARTGTRERLLEYLGSDSYQNHLADAAVAAIRAQDDPGYIPPLLDALRDREPAFSRDGFAEGLRALAHLARNESDKEPVRGFLERHVNSRKKPVQLAALSALGDLGDPKALAIVEVFARSGEDTPERHAAEQALNTLRAARKPADQLRDLRNEMLGLQRENRQLRQELEDLKKTVEAPGQASPPPKPDDAKKRKTPR